MEAELARQAGPVVVTLVYLVVYYVSQLHVARTKLRLAREARERGESFDRYFGHNREMLAADRIQLNTLEHMGPFLALLWMHALFIGPLGATIGGALYVASRILYPLLVGQRLGRGIPNRIVLATGVGYLVLVYFAGALLVSLVRSLVA